MDRTTRRTALALLAILWTAAACQTPAGNRFGSRLSRTAQAFERHLHPARILSDTGARLRGVAGTAGAMAEQGSRHLRRLGTHAPALLVPRLPGPSTAATARILTLDEIGRTRGLQQALATLRPDQRFPILARSLRNSGAVLGLDRTPLPHRSDWNRRTDPSDRRPPADFVERLLVRLWN